MNIEGVELHWLGHAGFRIRSRKIIYIDPFQIEEGPPADIILITHQHYDHCSIEDLKKISTPETLIFAPADCQSKLSDVLAKNITVLEPGQKLQVNGMIIETVKAYNTDKGFHPEENGWLGYILTLNGKRIYHAGDTDLIDEMGHIHVDVALLPVSGTYVMTAEEAAEAVKRIKPKASIPMHWGAIVGSREDAERFKELVGDSVHIPEKHT
ncbi:MAG: MBL fold metallo-hydrolase [Nanoarchaeota archaeon]